MAPIRCGVGDQDIRWLAVAAARRLGAPGQRPLGACALVPRDAAGGAEAAPLPLASADAVEAYTRARLAHGAGVVALPRPGGEAEATRQDVSARAASRTARVATEAASQGEAAARAYAATARAAAISAEAGTGEGTRPSARTRARLVGGSPSPPPAARLPKSPRARREEAEAYEQRVEGHEGGTGSKGGGDPEWEPSVEALGTSPLNFGRGVPVAMPLPPPGSAAFKRPSVRERRLLPVNQEYAEEYDEVAAMRRAQERAEADEEEGAEREERDGGKGARLPPVVAPRPPPRPANVPPLELSVAHAARNEQALRARSLTARTRAYEHVPPTLDAAWVSEAAEVALVPTVRALPISLYAVRTTPHAAACNYPQDRVRDTLRDGAHVWVALSRDAREATRGTLWTREAFQHSLASQQRASQLEQEKEVRQHTPSSRSGLLTPSPRPRPGPRAQRSTSGRRCWTVR